MFSNVPARGRNTKIRNESVRIGLTERRSRPNLCLLCLQDRFGTFFMKKFEELDYLVMNDDAYVLNLARSVLEIIHLINKMAERSS